MNKKLDDERLQNIFNFIKKNNAITDKELIQNYYLEEEDNFIEDEENTQFEPFSIKEDIKNTHFDNEGNLIPNLEEEDMEEDAEEEDTLINFDKECALESLQYLIKVLDKNETISDAITRLYCKGEDETGNDVTDYASNLMFMGMQNIYQCNE